jgi:hypothetical protein
LAHDLSRAAAPRLSGKNQASSWPIIPVFDRHTAPTIGAAQAFKGLLVKMPPNTAKTRRWPLTIALALVNPWCE